MSVAVFPPFEWFDSLLLSSDVVLPGAEIVERSVDIVIRLEIRLIGSVCTGHIPPSAGRLQSLVDPQGHSDAPALQLSALLTQFHHYHINGHWALILGKLRFDYLDDCIKYICIRSRITLLFETIHPLASYPHYAKSL